MRRKDREINDLNEIINIVKACQVMRLGMVGLRGEPYVVPVNFGWELQDEQLILYFHGATQGLKLDILREHPQVCFEFDTDHEFIPSDVPCGCSFKYASVISWGRVELLETDEAKAVGLRAIMRHFDCGTGDFDPEQTRRVSVGKLIVERLTGKRHA